MSSVTQPLHGQTMEKRPGSILPAEHMLSDAPVNVHRASLLGPGPCARHQQTLWSLMSTVRCSHGWTLSIGHSFLHCLTQKICLTSSWYPGKWAVLCQGERRYLCSVKMNLCYCWHIVAQCSALLCHCGDIKKMHSCLWEDSLLHVKCPKFPALSVVQGQCGAGSCEQLGSSTVVTTAHRVIA